MPRFATARCARRIERTIEDARAKAHRLAPGAPLDLLGAVTPLPPAGLAGVRVIGHDGHAPGHAALLAGRVLVAGDMLSDVEVPLLDVDAADPCQDYLHALDLLADVLPEVDVVVPGHGSIARGTEIGARLAADRRYVETLSHGTGPEDFRVTPGATYGRDWLPAKHRSQVAAVLQVGRSIG